MCINISKKFWVGKKRHYSCFGNQVLTEIGIGYLILRFWKGDYSSISYGKKIISKR